MKINKIICLLFFFLSVSSLVFTQDDYSDDGSYSEEYTNLNRETANIYKDPFEDLLPRGPEGTDDNFKSNKDDIRSGPPPINIEGVLWGTGEPRTIIDGEVYAVGDNIAISSGDVKIFKIKKNIVFITYGERIFEMNVKTKGVR